MRSDDVVGSIKQFQYENLFGVKDDGGKVVLNWFRSIK